MTIGGIIYDFAGWQGMSVFHVVCQASMVFLFTTQPSTRESFREFFSPESPDDNDELFQTVVPAPAKPALVAASRSNDGDLVVEEFAADLPGIAEDAEDARPGSGHSARSAQDEGEEGDLEPREGDPGQRRPRKSLQSRKSRRSVRSSKNRDSWHSGPLGPKLYSVMQYYAVVRDRTYYTGSPRRDPSLPMAATSSFW